MSLRGVSLRATLLTLVFLLLVGHAFGRMFLDQWASRQLADGFYLSVLSPGDRYATIDWDDFCYFPRSLAVAGGRLPLDPWSHEREASGWGPFPLLPPLLLGALTRLTGDLHLALYAVAILAVLLQGTMLTAFFMARPLGLPLAGALLAALVVMKFSWLAVRLVQWGPARLADDYGLLALVEGLPRDEFLGVEAGLLTYTPYVAFLLLFWGLVQTGRQAVVTGVLAGLLTYVYFYHQVFAFLLLATAGLIDGLRWGWRGARAYVVAVGAGLACALPHYVQLWMVGRTSRLGEYFRRLGYEEGRFDAQNLLTLLQPALLFLIAGAAYAAFRRPSTARSVCLRVFLATVLAYALLVNLRLVLGFDMNSDHYPGRALGLPATLWMMVAAVDLGGQWLAGHRRVRLGLALATGLLLVLTAGAAMYRARLGPWDPDGYAHWARGKSAQLSRDQRDMVERMRLLRAVARPGDVLAVDDPATAYHATVNAGVRLLAPLGLSLRSNQEILERFFAAQYLTGAAELRGPRDAGQPRDPARFVHARGEQLFLFINYEPPGPSRYGLDPGLRRGIETASLAVGDRLLAERRWRVDLVFGGAERRETALARMAKYFTVQDMREAGRYWIVRTTSAREAGRP